MQVSQQREGQLKQVRQTLEETLKTGDRLIDGSLDYLHSLKGKMLRPLLYFTLCDAHGEQPSLEVATALEMLHVATLIHDDIIDESKLRRGAETIQSKYSKEYAVYMGDYLFSSLFKLLIDSDLEKREVQLLSAMMQRICLAEMNQFNKRHDTSMSYYDYLRIISGKTAALFSLSTTLASKDLKERIDLYRFGSRLGILFQIQDDLLDYLGDPDLVGKDLRKDILVGNYNLPVIIALEAEPQRAKELLLSEDPLADHRFKRLLEETKALERTRELLLRYEKKVYQDLDKLPNHGELKDLVDQIMGRHQ